MRQTTLGTLNTFCAISADMMLRLSPLVRAQKASASSIPARLSMSSSMPLPSSAVPAKFSPRREKEFALWSITVTSWPSSVSSSARRAPTPPQPTIATFTEQWIMPQSVSRYDLSAVRFAFTFMGLLSIALGAWIVGYLLLHPTSDGVTVGLEVVPAMALFAFGGWLLYRRAVHGRAA